MTDRSVSASSRSPMSVEPVMSLNTTVTILRWSTGACAAIALPQNWQNLASSEFSPPQLAQFGAAGV